MLARKVTELGRRYLPAPLKRLARAAFTRKLAPAAPGARAGIVEDLCFWMADANVDTVLPLQNYFSVLYPELATATRGTLALYDHAGRALGRHPFELPAHGLVKLRVRDLLARSGARAAEGYGTLLCDIEMPDAVRATLDPAERFFFWDRFYIAYEPRGGMPCFVHGVDKTYVADAFSGVMTPFYPPGSRYTWVPEIPVDLTAYARFSVVVVNRTAAPAALTLTVTDGADASRVWDATVAALGAHRFVLRPDDLGAAVDPRDLRLRLDGIPTRWGRPVVFKEFRHGAISAMHC